MPRPLIDHRLTIAEARRLWLAAQRLDQPTPFGAGPAATQAAIEHLGYVQIDTIHVIERAHHHILFTRIPAYVRADLHQVQTVDKTVFEYWTHALAYVPTQDLRFYLPAMQARRRTPGPWYAQVSKGDLRRMLARIKSQGPLSIRDVEDDLLVEKDHPWASRKPSKRVLQLAFMAGLVAVSERQGMLKTYELIERHFGWNEKPRAASEAQILAYLLDRALRAQGVVSLDSVCYLDARHKPGIRALIERRVRRRELAPVRIVGLERIEHWARPEQLAAPPAEAEPVHILSPFDPLVIQRKRLHQLFGYQHLFEAYVPKARRTLGYFALPVLIGDRIMATLDLKTDRAAGRLLVQQWSWQTADAEPGLKARIEAALDDFERFQLATALPANGGDDDKQGQVSAPNDVDSTA